nr:MAG: RdRp [Plasmopara viticola lesion associated narnavirus 4]
MRRNNPTTFDKSPLTVYDVDEWDPLEDYEDYSDSVPGTLDLKFLEDLGMRTHDTLVEYGIPVPHPTVSRVEGEEVGDDRVDFSNAPERLAAGLVCQEEVCRMVTSKKDTFLSQHLWNFCEVTGIVPVHPGQGFDHARKGNDFKNLGFVDVPPMRILLDVSKGDRSHSSTSVGKATMLGSRSRTTRPEFSADWHLASYLQDGFLRTSRSSEPKYLPQIMGGSGVRAAFANAENLFLYTIAYRGGVCERIYGSATRELRQSLASLEEKEVIMPILCRRLRDRQEYLHGTYAEKIFIPDKEYISSFRNELPTPLIKASGGNNLFSNFENRLLRTRHVVTQTSAEKEWEVTFQIRSRLLSRYQSTNEANKRQAFDRMRARSEFGDALNANTAFANLLQRKGTLEDVIRLTNKNFLVVKCGAIHFTRWDADWLFYGGKSENFSIEDLSSSEDLYLRTDVSEDETMRVGNIPLVPLIKELKTVTTTTSVGLYQIGSGMYEWASKLASRLASARERLGGALSRDDTLPIYKLDPEWINDDTLIIARCLQDTVGRSQRTTTVILVSADKRLGNQLSNTCNVYVIRIDPKAYIGICLENTWDPMSELDPMVLTSYLRPGTVRNPVEYVYTDTGSVAAYLSKIQSYESGTMWIKHIESDPSYLPRLGEKRGYEYTLTSLGVPQGMQSMTHRPTYQERRFRNPEPFGSEASHRKSVLSSRSSTSKDWRQRT